jgi:hypothetical protein
LSTYLVTSIKGRVKYHPPFKTTYLPIGSFSGI